MKYLLKFDDAAHSDEAVLSSDAVRCRSRAVGHAANGSTSRGNCGIVSRSCSSFCSAERNWMLTGITFFRLTERDIFRRTKCTVKTAAKNTVVTAPLPTIMLEAGASGRRFSRLRPILKKDGARKNDAAARLLEDVRREHPHLKLVEDGLAGPHLLKGLDLRLGAKPGDHKFLVDQQRTVRGTPRVHGRERHTAPVRSPSERYAPSK